MFDVKQIHRDRYARCLQSILINCVTAEKKNNLLTTVATKSIASGKENVKRERLKGNDKTKYEIYDALKKAIPQSLTWRQLQQP